MDNVVEMNKDFELLVAEATYFFRRLRRAHRSGHPMRKLLARFDRWRAQPRAQEAMRLASMQDPRREALPPFYPSAVLKRHFGLVKGQRRR